MKKTMLSLNVKKKILVKAILFVCVLSFLCPLTGNTASAGFPKDSDEIRSIAENLYSLHQNQNAFFEEIDPTYKESWVKRCVKLLTEASELECQKNTELENLKKEYEINKELGLSNPSYYKDEEEKIRFKYLKCFINLNNNSDFSDLKA